MSMKPLPDDMTRLERVLNAALGVMTDTAPDLQAKDWSPYRTRSALAAHDPISEMHATRAIAAHLGAMDCYRRAAQQDLTLDVAIKLRKTAEGLSKLVVQSIEALRQRPPRVQAAPTPDSEPTVPAADPPSGTGRGVRFRVIEGTRRD
jgi:hypothetical protein